MLKLSCLKLDAGVEFLRRKRVEPGEHIGHAPTIFLSHNSNLIVRCSRDSEQRGTRRRQFARKASRAVEFSAWKRSIVERTTRALFFFFFGKNNRQFFSH